jgi:hypothetical protein
MIDYFSLETLLPFMLVLAIVYGAMDTAGIFRNRALKFIISVVVAFFSISNVMLVEALNAYLPYAAVFFLAVFVFGFIKKSLSGGGRDNTLIIIILGLFILLVASYTRTGGLQQYSDFLWFIGVAFLVILFYAAYKMKKPDWA